MTYGEQISQSTVDAMDADPNVLVMGAGVTDVKGIFGTTSPAADRFPDRVIETPLSENMLTGALVGLAQTGYKPIFVHARSDFMTLSAEHLVNTIAKWKYMGGGDLPIMVRCIIGQGWGNGPQHTQSFAHWFASVPGLSVFTPATRVGIAFAFDTWRRGESVVLFEHRSLYGTDLPDETLWGKPRNDVLLVGASASWPTVLAARDLLHGVGIGAIARHIDVWPSTLGAMEPAVLVDMQPRSPLMRTVRTIGSDIVHVSPPDYPCPASYPLEQAWYPSAERIANAALELLGCEPVFREPEQHVAAPTGGGPF